MQYDILGNDASAWAIALAAAAAVSLALLAVKHVTIGKLRGVAKHMSTCLDDLAITVLATTHPLFIILINPELTLRRSRETPHAELA